MLIIVHHNNSFFILLYLPLNGLSGSQFKTRLDSYLLLGEHLINIFHSKYMCASRAVLCIAECATQPPSLATTACPYRCSDTIRSTTLGCSE